MIAMAGMFGRISCALGAALLAMPLAAQDSALASEQDTAPDTLSASMPEELTGGLRGAWRGTVGDLPVHACFEGGDDRGVYYYDAQRKLIRLLNQEGIFSEAIGREDQGSATWRFTAIEGNRATGMWHDGATRLPIILRRLEWTTRDGFGGPCESGAFNQLRFEGGNVESRPATLEGRAYTQLRYVPPPHWRAENNDDIYPIDIKTFAIVERQDGDRAINHALSFYLPRGDAGDAFAECMAGNIASHGIDGDFSQQAVPELITERWLGLIESNAVYCGGAHPSYWQNRRVFDRRDGREVFPAEWLTRRAIDLRTYSSGVDTYVYRTVTAELQALLHRLWQQDALAEQECADLALETTSWDIGLVEEGLAFIPTVPHILTPCAATTIVAWADIEPFLNTEGLAVRQTF